MSDTELAKEMGVSPTTIKSYIRCLKADGKITTVTKRAAFKGSWKNRRTINIVGE